MIRSLPAARKHATYYTQSRPEMLALIPESAKTILEVGCGDGTFALGLRQQCARRMLHGIEYDAEAAASASAVFDVVVEDDALHALQSLTGNSYDTIVFNDILEHLVDPWECLRRARPLLAKNGCVVASIPNMRFWPILSDLFFHGNWNYREAGVMDATHLRYFTPKTIRALFETTGYNVEQMVGINGSQPSRKWQLINTLLGGRMNDCRFPQFAVVANGA